MYDAIIVGARCAGSPTAMLLARKGYKVLLVDRARFPSDTMSTHILWPHGAELMDRWGLLDRLAATGCPPVALNMIFTIGPFTLKGGVLTTNKGRGGFCPRRTILDKLLVDAAVESGAELREQFTVEELLREGDQVIGIQGRTRSGGVVKEKARIVIGADGTNSLIAKAVKAEEYEAIPPLATYYYSYYSGFEADDLEQHIRDHDGCVCSPTHDGLTLIGGVWPSKRFNEVRADIEGSLMKTLQGIPTVLDRLSRAKREEKWIGTAGVANRFRKPHGPGWALLGDAAYQKDPITAQGISDSFIDAENVANAVDDGLSGRRPLNDALAAYQASRDERVRPLYSFTSKLAAMEPVTPQRLEVFDALQGNRETTSQYFSAITGSTPLPEFMNHENLGRIVAEAAARAGR